MITTVCICKVKDKHYDFDNPEECPKFYFPTPLCKGQFVDGLYRDIVNDSTRRIMQDNFVIKLNKADLISYIDKDKYKKDGVFWFKDAMEYLLDTAKNLPDGEYLLVTSENDSEEYD